MIAPLFRRLTKAHWGLLLLGALLMTLYFAYDRTLGQASRDTQPQNTQPAAIAYAETGNNGVPSTLQSTAVSEKNHGHRLDDHDGRLQALDAQLTALQQEINTLKAQAGQCLADLGGLKAQSVPAPVAIEQPQSEDTLPQRQRQARPKPVHARKKHLARKRRQHLKQAMYHLPHGNAAPKPSDPALGRITQGFNKPLVVEAVNSWGAEKRVVVREPHSRALRHLKVGDDLGGYTIESHQGRDVMLRNQHGRTLLVMPERGPVQ